MRELKLRAWLKKQKCYAKVLGIGFYEGEVRVQYQQGELVVHNISIPFEDVILEQYTGLKDKNGKEIYEGDIIHRGALPKVNVFRNSVIRFDKESVGFIATSTRNGARTLFNGHTCDEIEVIGNIHENKELLEGK